MFFKFNFLSYVNLKIKFFNLLCRFLVRLKNFANYLHKYDIRPRASTGCSRLWHRAVKRATQEFCRAGSDPSRRKQTKKFAFLSVNGVQFNRLNRKATLKYGPKDIWTKHRISLQARGLARFTGKRLIFYLCL